MKKKNHKVSLDSIHEMVYGKSMRSAVRMGRRWGVVDPAAAEDVASAAYLAAARGALAELDADAIADTEGFTNTLVYRRTSNEWRREAAEKRKFEDSFLRLDNPDPEMRIDTSDHGDGDRRMVEAIDGEEPMPFWQFLTKLTVDGLPPDLRRIAKGFMTTWDPEKVRKKTKCGHAKFYRLKKNLKKLLRPCFIAYQQHEHRRFRPRK